MHAYVQSTCMYERMQIEYRFVIVNILIAYLYKVGLRKHECIHVDLYVCTARSLPWRHA